MKDFQPLQLEPGSDRLTEESQQKYRSKVQQFLAELAPQGEQRGAAGDLRDDGFCKLQQMRALDHTLFVSVGLGLRAFQADAPLRPLGADCRQYFVAMDDLPPALASGSFGRTRRSCIIDGNRQTKLETAWAPNRRVLHEIIDMGPCGWPVRTAMYTTFAIRGSYTYDVHHRRWYDALLSYGNSGLTLVRLECAMVYTFTAGPWHSDGWHGNLVSAVQQWSASSDHTDEIFQLMYPHIVREQGRGKLPSGFGSEEHQIQTWRGLPQCVMFARQGLQMKMNRWFQLVRKTQSMAPYWSTCLAVIMYIGMFKGWFRDLSEFPFLAGPRAEENVGAPALVVGDASCVLAAASSGSGSAPAGGGPGRSVRFSNDQISRLRSSCANGMHLAGRIMSMMETRAVIVGTAAVAAPVMEEHSLTVTILKTQSGSMSWRSEMALGHRCRHLRPMFESLMDREMLLDIGLLDYSEFNCTCLFTTDEAQRISTTLMTFCCHMLCREVILLMSYCRDFPMVFAGFLDRDEANRQRTADFCRKVFATLTEAEQKSHDDVWLADFLKYLIWPDMTWVREVFVALLEAGDAATAPPQDILDEIRDFCRGPCSTKPCEDGFNVLRAAAKQSPNGSLSRPARWQHCMSSNIVVESDFVRPPVVAQDEIDASIATQGRLGSTIFEAKSGNFSLGETAEQQYLRGPRVWASMSSSRYMVRSFALSALLESGGDVGKLKKAWLSKLLMPGQIAGRRVSGSADVRLWWVLGSFEYGFVGLPVVSKKHKGLKYLTPVWRDGPQPWDYCMVSSDWREWSCISVTAVPPVVSRKRFGIGNIDPHEVTGIVMEFQEVAAAHVAAAKRGFANFTVEDMKNFVIIAGVPYEGARPTTAYGLASLLIKWAIPGATKGDIKGYLSHRDKLKCPHETVLSEDSVSAVETFLKADEAHEAKETFKQHAGRRAPRPTSTSPGGRGADVAPSAASSSDGPGVEAPGAAQASAASSTAPKVALPEGVWSFQEAKAFLPGVPWCTICTHSNDRWQVKYLQRSRAPRSYSETWKDGVVGQSHYDVLVRCLTWAWSVHAEECPGAPPCPFDLPGASA